MYLLGKAFGFRFVSFLQPTVYHKFPKTKREQQIEEATPELATFAREQYEATRPRLEELNRKHGQGRTVFVDLSQALSSHPVQTYWDYIHTDNKGNEFIGAQMLSNMMSQHLFDTTSGSQ
jgi:hypothetical protein